MICGMNEEKSVPASLKALREKARLSIREMARRVSMSSSGYGHYENEDRFKGQYLPKAQAHVFASALASEGIDPAEVMRLAGDERPNALVPVAIKDDLVPIYNVQASAGGGLVVGEEYVADRVGFPPHYLRDTLKCDPRDLSIVSVNGSSMLKTLKHGDLVMVDVSKRNPNYDGMFLLRTDDTLRVKRIKKPLTPGIYTLVSDNKSDEYPEEVWPEGRVEIIGRVVWVGGTV